MKSIMITTSLLVVLCAGSLMAQQSITLSFTAINNTSYVSLDSIKVMNLTKDRDTMLVWNDTILMLNLNVGLIEQEANKGLFVQAYPNPANEFAILKAETPEAGKLLIRVSNVRGSNLLTVDFNLPAGIHEFSFTPGNEAVYFISFAMNGKLRQFKLINENPVNADELSINYKASLESQMKKDAPADYNPFVFGLGDELLYIGYIDSFESAISDQPQESHVYTFQFAHDIPCVGVPSVSYEGQVYQTVQIFSQCWLKENLNVGDMIPADQSMKDNGVIEKYCYKNNADSCQKYGGLYQWDEVMQYSVQQGAQGICPPGWHLPSDNEWKILEGTADSQHDAGDPLWGTTGYRGFDAGKLLKATNGWRYFGNGTDAFGFMAIPGGYRQPDGLFDYVGNGSYWWLAAEKNTTDSWYRDLRFNKDDVYRGTNDKEYGFSVRCIKD